MMTAADWFRQRLAGECGPRILNVVTERGTIGVSLLDGEVYQNTFWAADGTPLHMTIHIEMLAALYGDLIPPGVIANGARLPNQAWDALLARCRRNVARPVLDDRGQPATGPDGRQIVELLDNSAMTTYLAKWRSLGYI